MLQGHPDLKSTPDGFPLAYEAMDGNTADKTTLRGFLEKIESTYGRAERMWVMDRGIPTEALLEEMRRSERQIRRLVGTPRARITAMEKKWLDLPWQKVRDSIEVKLSLPWNDYSSSQIQLQHIHHT
jgi:transposase